MFYTAPDWTPTTTTTEDPVDLVAAYTFMYRAMSTQELWATLKTDVLHNLLTQDQADAVKDRVLERQGFVKRTDGQGWVRVS